MPDFDIIPAGFEQAAREIPQLDTRAILAAGAAEYKAQWHRHFKALDAKGNSKGWPSKHFWLTEGVGKTDIAMVAEDFAAVACSSPAVAYQSLGGTIRPRSARGIVVPVSAQAYAAGWPSNSGLPLSFIPFKSRRHPYLVGKLVETAATRIGYGKKGVINKGDNAATVGTTHWLVFLQITKKKPMGNAVYPDPAIARPAVERKMAAALHRQTAAAKTQG